MAATLFFSVVRVFLSKLLVKQTMSLFLESNKIWVWTRRETNWIDDSFHLGRPLASVFHVKDSKHDHT